MKITQLQFSLTSSLQKPHRPKITSSQSPISPSILNSSQVSSYFKSHQSNKRLKYYSTRNKDSNNVINDENIEILKEEFKKFQDRNLKSFENSKENSNREVFNLIVKKYYKKSKLSHEFIDKKTKKQKYKSIISQTKVTISDKSIKPLSAVETVYPQMSTQKENAQKYPNEKKQTSQIKSEHQQVLKQTFRGSSFSVTPKNNMRTFQVPSERLNRHRFNKSSITQLSHRNSFKKVNNFIATIDSSIRKDSETINDRMIQSCRSQRSKYSKAKRFIKMGNTDFVRFQDEQKIDPYTQRQYLHVQLKSQNQKLKTFQKFINSSIIENNMIKSFQVKTITPQVGNGITDRIEKKYASMKEGFYKKIRSYSVTGENNSKGLKIKDVKEKNEQLNGWEIGQKIVYDQYAEIA